MANKKTNAETVSDKKKFDNIELVFKYVNVTCEIDPDIYDSADATEIRRIVKHASTEIHVDQSYVAYKDNKYEYTYMTPEGWTELCDLISSTEYGKKATKTENAILMSAYRMMILFYLYDMLKYYGYDICDSEGILLDIKKDSPFMIEYMPLTHKAWKLYPGKWQTWKKKK